MNLTLLAELYKQSHVTVPHQPTGGLDARTEDTVFIPDKFAELIVRECAAVVFKNTGPKSALNILEHFGVEE